MSVSQNADIVTAAVRAPTGHVQLTSLATAVAFSAAQIPARSKRVLLQAETQNIRFRDDGTSPTASVGMILLAGATPFEYVGDISTIQFIQVTTSAKLNAAFYE